MSSRALKLMPLALGALGAVLLVRFAGTGAGSQGGRASPQAGTNAAAEAAHRAAGLPSNPSPQVATAFQERVHVLEARVEAQPEDRELLLELARLLHDGHRAGEAVPFYRRAIELDSTDAQATYDLAAALTDDGDWGAAGALLEAWIARYPKDASALYNLGAVHANQGDLAGARSWWSRGLEVTDDAALKARLEASLARIAGGGDR